ncbi:lysophospholipid acyltransferase family protein [Neobacillus sp. SM06]|uniref:lysophospholipid acyltransferase family protein n=1 Tax=Neobacillus sp. SM06 TaxID=3422492 RepID=UPI003D2AE0AD
MADNFYGKGFRLIRGMVRVVYPSYSLKQAKLPDTPVVFVSHHQNLFGPFIILLWFPRSLHAWILHVFLDQKACYRQYVDFTFTKRFGFHKLVAKGLAYPISFFISKLLNSGKGIPVYRGSRKILHTFQQSVAALKNGESLIIFPDTHYQDSSAGTNEMYDGFLFLEKYYYKETGKHVCFVPLYASKKKKTIIAGSPVYFPGREDFQSERKFVLGKIHDHLNELARRCGDLS